MLIHPQHLRGAGWQEVEPRPRLVTGEKLKQDVLFVSTAAGREVGVGFLDHWGLQRKGHASPEMGLATGIIRRPTCSTVVARLFL